MRSHCLEAVLQSLGAHSSAAAKLPRGMSCEVFLGRKLRKDGSKRSLMAPDTRALGLVGLACLLVSYKH